MVTDASWIKRLRNRRQRHCRTLQLLWMAFRPLVLLLHWIAAAVVIYFGMAKLFASR